MKKDFTKFVSSFKSSIKTWDYLINWNKVQKNAGELELVLNKLNYLLGKPDIKKEFFKLYENSPDIVKAFPTLLAVRESIIEIYNSKEKTIEIFNFIKKNHHSSKEYFRFLTQSKLIELFNKDGIKNLVDYVKGVEVGLDSNGRKNRGGTLMEDIVELHIKEFCEINNYKYLRQANARKILKEFDTVVKVNKSSRSFDFAIFNPKNKKLNLIETNFFNGGGSKLKAVCGEFKGLNLELKSQNINFIWITDGKGWHTTLRPLEEVYIANDHIFNLSMVENGILNEFKW